jgi:hypothetical protein
MEQWNYQSAEFLDDVKTIHTATWRKSVCSTISYNLYVEDNRNISDNIKDLFTEILPVFLLINYNLKLRASFISREPAASGKPNASTFMHFSAGKVNEISVRKV